MSDSSKKKKKYDDRHFQNTEIMLGGEKLYISPALKLLGAWIVFFLILFIFISVAKKGISGKPDEPGSSVPGQVSQGSDNMPPDNSSQGTPENAQITVPMDVNADPELNQFVAEYLTAMTNCDQAALKTMVTDPSVYDDMSALQARAQFIKGYINLKCYTKQGPADNTLVVFVTTNTTLANIATAPMDFMTLYIDTSAGYIINNYTQPDDVKAYINTLKRDSDIQKVMQDVDTYNSMAMENDADLRAFYDMLGQ
ncbi:MAG: hypothetical protein K2G89_09120 [Lachnospiraceae bacterium]|nr:hypothetical protein [Lachnospiraceae bacterium]